MRALPNLQWAAMANAWQQRSGPGEDLMQTPVTFTVNTTPLLETSCDALLIPVQQDAPLRPNAAALDAALDGLIGDMRERREFRGEPNQVAVMATLGRLSAARVVLLGLGKPADLTPVVAARAFASAARTLGKRAPTVCATDLADLALEASTAAVAIAEGVELSRFALDLYRTRERPESGIRELLVSGATEAALRQGSIRGQARNIARNLVNEPGNVLDPPELARRAQSLAEEAGLEVEVLDEEAMQRLNMHAILTVTRGAETGARFILLRHRGAAGDPDLALVGKAVTFDTGGISLKPVTEMGKMKGDMAGGAAVVGAMWAIGQLKLALHVIGLVPAAVNMPDGRAWMPGDVVNTRSGKTVETVTTDAEGRMLLADALDYARELKAARVVDIATLTGACVVALGHVASALYGTDADLVELLRACGEETGERHWPMPLFPEYGELNRSEIADLKNSGGRTAGSITAAHFLREFAGDTPWAHLDIAGTSQHDKGKPWAPAGPSGTGVGTFIRLAEMLAHGDG